MGAGYPRNPCESVDKIDRRASADDTDGHGKGTGYPRNPCESVDKIDRRASADDADGHGRGTGYPRNPRKSADKIDGEKSGMTRMDTDGGGLSVQSVQIRGQNRRESVRG